MNYEVRLDSFEGPLDLLYQMVKKNEIELNEISLARITEQYLEYTGYFQSFDLEVASEFIMIAGELIQLKTKYLLPETDVDEEKEEETDLVARLQEYERFKKLAEKLKKYHKRAEKIYGRPPELTHLTEEEFRLQLDLQPDKLREIYREVLWAEEEKQQLASREEINYLQEEKYQVEDKIILIKSSLSAAEGKKIAFSQFLEDRSSFLEIAVTLLALLELVAKKEVRVSQKKLFGEIVVTRTRGDKTG